jgi:ribosomal protein S18 acetylase RimI-like enzyme
MSLPDGFSLRTGTTADVAAYGAFYRSAFAATYGPHHEAEEMQRHLASRFADDILREELESPERTLLLLESQGEVAGIALLRAGAGSLKTPAERPVEVERFYVGTPWQGKGVAAPLMQAALAAARAAGHDVVWLGVWEQNPRAIRFYEKQGFEVVGTHFYVFDGKEEDDLLMAVRL